MTDSGVIIIPAPYTAGTGVELAYDPNLSTPATVFRGCAEDVLQCIRAGNSAAGCVAAEPRCPTLTPWLDEEPGSVCCPEQCLATYFQEKTAGADDHAALLEMAWSGCMWSDAGVPAADAGGGP